MKGSIQETLLFQLYQCGNMLHRGHAHGHGGGHEGHRGQGRVVALLKERSPLSQRELAEMLHIKPPSLSEVLDKLEARGLVERIRNESDKRMSDVKITEAGLKQAEEVEGIRQKHAEELLAGLTPEEQEALSVLLAKLLKSLDGMHEDGMHGRGMRGHGPHGRHCAHGAHGEHGGPDDRECRERHEHHGSRGHHGCCGRPRHGGEDCGHDRRRDFHGGHHPHFRDGE